MKMKRLLYLGFAFPPRVSGLFPELQPAGQIVETSLVESIRPHFEIRSIGVASVRVEGVALPSNPSPGLPNALNLLDKPPEVFHRYRSLWKLERAYRSWQKTGWQPDAIMVCNLSPIYNGFIRWLTRHARPLPPLILYLADSVTLGRKVPWFKAFRYRFKPLVYPEAAMLPFFRACVGVSVTAEAFFAPRGIPWLWLPNGCDPRRAIKPHPDQIEGPIRFGYFGALAKYAGLPALLKVFTARERAASLHICGYGKAKTKIEAACRMRSGLRFYGPRTPDECLRFALNCDVLVNPRPLWPGNDNNFSSKVFEYALSGRAILTSKVSGIDAVLGEKAYYFDEGDFERSLDRRLEELAAIPRTELRRRGAAIQERLLRHYSWAQQGEKLARFLERVVTPQSCQP